MEYNDVFTQRFYLYVLSGQRSASKQTSVQSFLNYFRALLQYIEYNRVSVITLQF